MFAVVRTGGKQYKVANNDVITVEKLAGAAGDSIKLTDVLMVGDDKGTKIGDPLVKGAAVTAEILEQGRAKKIIVFKKKRRQGYRRKAGHRQDITVLRITAIGDSKAPAKAETKAKAKAPAKAKAAQPAKETKAPAKKAAAAKKPAPEKKASAAKAKSKKKES